MNITRRINDSVDDLVIPSNLYIGQSAFIGGSLYLEQDLLIQNDTMINENLVVMGDSHLHNLAISNTLIVNGEVDLNYLTNIKNNLIVTGSTDLNNLTVSNDVLLHGRVVVDEGSTLFVHGDVVTNQTGTFDINRKATFSAGLSAGSTSVMTRLLIDNLDCKSAIFSGPVIFSVSPIIPVDVVYPTYVESISLILNDDNRGHLIDATESSSYTIQFKDNISPGSEWELYISSNTDISILNHTTKAISVSGFINEDGDNIFIPRTKEYIYYVGDHIICMEPSDIQSAYYRIVVTSTSDTDIRILFSIIFT